MSVYTPGTCCCKSNVKAAYVLGIIFVILCILNCLMFFNDENLYNIIGGIVGALMNGILVYGAYARSSTAILVWIILAIIECICMCVLTVLIVIALGYAKVLHLIHILVVAIYAGIILFTIWTIVIAKNARIEIKEGFEEGQGQFDAKNARNEIRERFEEGQRQFDAKNARNEIREQGRCYLWLRFFE